MSLWNINARLRPFLGCLSKCRSRGFNLFQGGRSIEELLSRSGPRCALVDRPGFHRTFWICEASTSCRDASANVDREASTFWWDASVVQDFYVDRDHVFCRSLDVDWDHVDASACFSQQTTWIKRISTKHVFSYKFQQKFDFSRELANKRTIFLVSEQTNDFSRERANERFFTRASKSERTNDFSRERANERFFTRASKSERTNDRALLELGGSTTTNFKKWRRKFPNQSRYPSLTKWHDIKMVLFWETMEIRFPVNCY